jgi:hypothetical protein
MIGLANRFKHAKARMVLPEHLSCANKLMAEATPWMSLCRTLGLQRRWRLVEVHTQIRGTGGG